MTRAHFVEKSTRRVFLCTTAAMGATLGCAGSNSGSDPEAFGTVSAGNVSDLPVGTLQAIANAPAFIGRDAEGLYAMTSTCTHEGCDMTADGEVSASGVFCGCHGSRFDANGAVVQGPANAPLTHFAVTVDAAGNVSVEGGTKVSASTRTAVA
jgi:cytochrome b6-f complex iron-sulfur subunit